MATAERRTYLADLVKLLSTPFPDNRTVNIVCHGHSVPAGYFATPVIDSFGAYPHLWHVLLKERFPLAQVNVIVTAIGSESSDSGAERFQRDVLRHGPDLVTIDYCLNDRRIGVDLARRSWQRMVRECVESGVRVLLLTPTWETSCLEPDCEQAAALRELAEMVRGLSAESGVGLVDSYAAYEREVARGIPLDALLSAVNHPNRAGHALVARELVAWFPC